MMRLKLPEYGNSARLASGYDDAEPEERV